MPDGVELGRKLDLVEWIGSHCSGACIIDIRRAAIIANDTKVGVKCRVFKDKVRVTLEGQGQG